ncbi:MAG: spermidine synthase [Legionellales bacterium]
MWQTKLGRCIYVSPSGYKVYQNVGYRWLTLGSNALQTVINRRNPQIPVLHYLPALSLMVRTFPNKCCLLGLGGGGIAHMLSSYTTSQPITAVDCSEEVIQTAKHFFSVDSISNLIIVHQNALDYVNECTLEYPHIMVDLYGANQFPAECATAAFFNNCKSRLAPDGFIAVNLANLKEQWPIFQLIKQQFKTTIVIPVKRCANMIIIASKNEDSDFFITKLRATDELKKIIRIQPWGYVGIL